MGESVKGVTHWVSPSFEFRFRSAVPTVSFRRAESQSDSRQSPIRIEARRGYSLALPVASFEAPESDLARGRSKGDEQTSWFVGRRPHASPWMARAVVGAREQDCHGSWAPGCDGRRGIEGLGWGVNFSSSAEGRRTCDPDVNFDIGVSRRLRHGGEKKVASGTGELKTGGNASSELSLEAAPAGRRPRTAGPSRRCGPRRSER